ncbi:hypothetical protein [Rhodoferax ferrireducens]|uniref:hypothetical protein n=1 Tax=Rhodoferax ferrireducens TaxID=192843 RepID=UPI003BB5DB08
MTILIAFLQSIPDVIWSGVIASILTLSGVLISNRSNTNRLKLQLQHDATETAKERTSTLRREVYLRTAEELVKTNAHLASLPQLDVTKTNLADGLQGFASAAARLQLVAEPKTALLVSQLASEYGELVFKLMAHLIPASKSKTDIRIADDLYTKAQAEVTRLLSEMAKLNESGKPDPQVFQALDMSFKFQQSQAKSYADERNAAWASFNRHNLVFQRYLLAQLRDIGSKQIPVMIEIRRDLGLTGDLDEIEAHMQRQWLRMESHLDALIVQLNGS